MTPIVFTDLDDTVFQTARKMASEPLDALLASRANNGSHSYLTEAQAAMFTWLNASTRLIPVTARSTEALSRCTLPFKDYQVASNGAVILTPEGRIDEEWMARTRRISEMHKADLIELTKIVTNVNGDAGLRFWTVEEQGCGIYFCVKSNGDESRLDFVQDLLEGALQMVTFVRKDFLLHRNGNNLSITPAAISKRAAVDYLIRKIGMDPATPIWGMGDSKTDLPFMEACQMMVIPTGSQAHTLIKESASHA